MFMVQEMKTVLLGLMKPRDMINLVMVFQIEELVSESQLLVLIEAIKVDLRIEDLHQMLILIELQL